STMVSRPRLFSSLVTALSASLAVPFMKLATSCLDGACKIKDNLRCHVKPEAGCTLGGNGMVACASLCAKSAFIPLKSDQTSVSITMLNGKALAIVAD